MKKFIVLMMVLMLSVQGFGATYASFLKSSGVDGVTMGINGQRQLTALQPGRIVHSGRTYYVDSATGDSASNGESWITAMATIDQAINRAAARVANGTDTGRPIIYVREYHNEAVTAGSIAADLAGLKIIGLGNGNARPKLDYDVGTGTFIIGAADVTIENFLFRSSVTAAVVGLVISADFATVRDCEFRSEGDAITVDEFNSAIIVRIGADGAIIENNLFNARAAGAINAISMGSISGITIRGNTIIGDYSSACITGFKNFGTSPVQLYPTEVIITNNLLFNGTMGGDGQINTVASLVMADNSSGYVGDNRIVCHTATGVLMRVGDDMVFMNNMTAFTDGDEFSGGLESGAASITLSQSQDGD